MGRGVRIDNEAESEQKEEGVGNQLEVLNFGKPSHVW